LALLIAQYRDTVAPPLRWVVPQRIVAPQPVRIRRAEPHRDRRTRVEARQVAPVRVDQFVGVDLVGQPSDRADAQQHAPLSARTRGNANPALSCRADSAPRRRTNPSTSWAYA